MKKIIIDEEEMPDRWYNLQSEIKAPPPLNPSTLEPVKASDLEKIFPRELIRQELSEEKWISIPQEVREIYRIWRPTPLYRAERLEKFLKTPAKIYYKWEGTSPPGSHKPNTAVAQAYYNSREGIERLTTETGAGQWGSALAFACSVFGLKCTVYMVKCSFEQKPYRRILMETWGAEVIASPSGNTDFGRKVLEEDPDSSGSLGIAISEAIEDAITHENTKYSLGSVLNHVLLHQTIIGLELKKQFEKIDSYPDMIFGCVGGGSNFSGGIFPFIPDKIKGNEIRFIACEPTACPSLTKGIYTYDYGDTAKMTPLLKMFTLGHSFIPPAIHAGGLRYHGDAPLLCKIVKDGIVEKRAYSQKEVFEAAKIFAKSEGFLIAPESAHALKGVIDEAIKCKKENEEKTICFLNSGHGAFDLSAYDIYNRGALQNYELSDKEIFNALKKSNINIDKLYT
ncbi:MAG: TrpB-like pyridoxal phosphate-dependent enzyme [Thermoplasmatales archaeon]|nr:TrpB-like pyridoxal phosphate-dependent enzyme [Thermoplasmatales archaeon]